MKYVLPVALVLSGCAGGMNTMNTTYDATPQRQRGSVPEVGTETEARVGDKIYSAFNYVETSLPTSRTLSGPVSGRFMMSNVSVPAGATLVKRTQDRFCTTKKYYEDPLTGPQATVCFEDKDQDGRVERAGVKPGLMWFWNDLDPAVQVNVEEPKTVSYDDGGFRKELIYQGRDDDTLRVQYREYVDNTARPAFSQDLTYPITDGGAEITFQNLNISVSDVRDAEIVYTVNSGVL